MSRVWAYWGIRFRASKYPVYSQVSMSQLQLQFISFFFELSFISFISFYSYSLYRLYLFTVTVTVYFFIVTVTAYIFFLSSRLHSLVNPGVEWLGVRIQLQFISFISFYSYSLYRLYLFTVTVYTVYISTPISTVEGGG